MPVIVGTDPVVAAVEPEPVIETFDVLPVDAAAVPDPVVADAVFDPEPVVADPDAVESVAVERLGRVEAAEAAMAKATATAADRWRSLIVCVIVENALKKRYRPRERLRDRVQSSQSKQGCVSGDVC